MPRLRSRSGRRLAGAVATALLAGALATVGRLRSGPYYVVVLSSTARSARPVACGHLF